MTTTTDSTKPAAPAKTWGAMTATERLAQKIAYLRFNYGSQHALTQAAERGDIDAFRRAGAHFTEYMDAVVVDIIDAPDGPLETQLREARMRNAQLHEQLRRLVTLIDAGTSAISRALQETGAVRDARATVAQNPNQH